MKVKNKIFSEKEIDEVVTAQANDESAWILIQSVKSRAKRESREKFLQVLCKLSKIEPTKMTN